MNFYQPTATPEEAILMQTKQALLLQENYQRSQNEQILYNCWKSAEHEKNTAKYRVDQLQSQLDKIHKMYEELNTKYSGIEKKLSNKTEELGTVEYNTDEEELARETGWIRAKNRKKRKMDTSLTPPPQQTSRINAERPKKVQAPPPIIVDNINNFNDLHAIVSQLPSAQIKVLNDKNVKINPQDETNFKLLSAALNEKKYSWHSYENKQNRPIKVMANRLHHSVKPEHIVQEMQKRGYKLIEATPKLKYKTKQPLNMFMLSFNHNESVDKIYGITDILGVSVEILPLRKSRLVPQCKRCQAYGHTQKYCAMEPRCVRCTGKHLTMECEKPKNTQPKCVHCGEGHPANYRGCIVAKEMQKLKDKRTKKPALPKQPQRNNEQAPADSASAGKKTYSQTVTGKPTTNHTQELNQNVSIQNSLQQIMEKLTQMDERISRLENSAKGAIPKYSNGR